MPSQGNQVDTTAEGWTSGSVERARKTDEMHAQVVQRLSVGRIVHYVLESGRSKGDHRPAIVVRDWKQENGLVQLQVFTDGHNDEFRESTSAMLDGKSAAGITFSANIIWRTSVHYDENKEPGTWHWIERT